MWLEAVLSRNDFAALAEQILPLSIHFEQPLGANHYVRLIGPADVALVAGKGLRLTCKAEIRWPVLGLEIPLDVESLTILLEPSIEGVLGEEEASFKLELEHADFEWVPALVDRGIVHAINAALHDDKARLTWQFAKTLSHVFELPPMLDPLHALSLKVAWGKLRTTEEAVVFAVSFHTDAIQHAASPEPPTPVIEEQDRLTDPDREPRSLGPGVVVAAGAALALVTGYMAFGGLYRRLVGTARERHRSPW